MTINEEVFKKYDIDYWIGEKNGIRIRWFTLGILATLILMKESYNL